MYIIYLDKSIKQLKGIMLAMKQVSCYTQLQNKCRCYFEVMISFFPS